MDLMILILRYVILTYYGLYTLYTDNVTCTYIVFYCTCTCIHLHVHVYRLIHVHDERLSVLFRNFVKERHWRRKQNILGV